MATARAVAVVLGILGGVEAQQFVQLFECPEVVRRFAADATKGKVAAGPVERFALLLQQLLQDEGLGAKSNLTIRPVNPEATRLMARCASEEMDVVKGALEQLRLDPLPWARVQCSLLTMPATLVKEHGLTVDAFVRADEVAFGKLVRDAVKQKGTLVNLPEVIAEPLVPFVAEPASKPGEPVPAAGATLRVRGEMVPLRPGEVGFAVQVVRGKLPADRTELPGQPLLHRAFRLEAGKSARAVVVEGKNATVVFVRCLEVPALAGDGKPK